MNTIFSYFSKGGMWGIYNDRDRPLANQIFQQIIDLQTSYKYNFYKNQLNQDESFLSKFVYPLLRTNSIIQDSYTCLLHNDSQAFPTQLTGACHIGNESKGCETELWNFSCPVECRPKEHQDWIYC